MGEVGLLSQLHKQISVLFQSFLGPILDTHLLHITRRGQALSFNYYVTLCFLCLVCLLCFVTCVPVVISVPSVPVVLCDLCACCAL